MKKYLSFLLFLIAFNSYPQSNIDISLYAGGFNQPLYITNDGIVNSNENKLYVVEQGGKVKILINSQINSIPFIDLSSILTVSGEQGLLGLAFHPNYANNGYFYVNYTNLSGNTQVSRFSVDSNNPNLADPNSELPLISYAQPFTNHNGGCLNFGPDGYLYISSGDGGSGGDPGNRAQNKNVLLGKLLRIDVDNPSGSSNYGIPQDNPFVGDPNAKEEIWAYGLRNPWRFSFDFTDNNILIGDVGQGNIEEVDRVSVTEAGLNYGWRCYEGTQAYNTEDCPPESEITFPLHQYTHDNGNCSITGGYVYRGNANMLTFGGHYFYADYCSGLVAELDENGQLLNQSIFTGKNWVSFGEDVSKELYLVDIANGDIYEMISILSTSEFSMDVSLTVLPNPASEKVSFSLKNGKIESIFISDIKGSILFSEKNISAAEKIVPISSFSSGIYFAEITSNKNQSTVKKLIVE